MQHSMLHTIYTLLSVPNQVPSNMLVSFQSIAPLLAEVDPKNYSSRQQQFNELAQEIERATQSKGLIHKTVVGFGGGFSAGKSRFINSLLGVDVLPEALEPCTAVATYLSHSPHDHTQALNLFGHTIELKAHQLGQLRHFVDNTDSIHLGQLIRHVHLGLPAVPWHNIALLDTPGYSKADSQHHAQNDERIARDQLSTAQHVVWLVNAKNGTIRDEDLQFLQQLDLSNPIFVVLTQSDLVNRADLQPIMDGVAKHLSNKHIKVAGLMAWAAPIAQNQGERLFGDDILAWFDKINQPVWQSYQDKLDLLMGRFIPVAQIEVATVEQQYQQINALFGLPELSAEQTKVMKRYAIEKANQKMQMNMAVIKLHDHYLMWSKRIAELGVDSRLTIEGILQQNYSDEEIRSFYEMGELYRQNNQLKNTDKAVAWYVKAASYGDSKAEQAIITIAASRHPKACYWLAEIFLKARADHKHNAADWYKKALALGEPLALAPARNLANNRFRNLQYQIGLVYTEGTVTPCDLKEAAYWYEKAAKQGHVLAQVAFADDLYHRLGEHQQALQWYQQAAYKGHVEAAYQAGSLHAHFNQLDQAAHHMSLAAKSKHSKARSWLEQQEHHLQSAAYCLAQMYENGQGVNKSVDIAVQKYTVLVRQNHANAQQRLLGLAGPKNLCAILALADIAKSHLKDLAQACKWHSMAIEFHDHRYSLQSLYDQACTGLQDAQDALKSLADRLNRAKLQYQYGLLSAYKNQHDTACDYMALAAAQEQSEAYRWLKQYSEKDIYAQSKMIYLFENGKVDQEDIKVIFDYYYLAIRRGEPRFSAVLAHANKMDIAKHLLATCYAFGYGVSINLDNAYTLYCQSAKSIPNSCYNSAVMIYSGFRTNKKMNKVERKIFEDHFSNKETHYFLIEIAFLSILWGLLYWFFVSHWWFLFLISGFCIALWSFYLFKDLFKDCWGMRFAINYFYNKSIIFNFSLLSVKKDRRAALAQLINQNMFDKEVKNLSKLFFLNKPVLVDFLTDEREIKSDKTGSARSFIVFILMIGSTYYFFKYLFALLLKSEFGHLNTYPIIWICLAYLLVVACFSIFLSNRLFVLGFFKKYASYKEPNVYLQMAVNNTIKPHELKRDFYDKQELKSEIDRAVAEFNDSSTSSSLSGTWYDSSTNLTWMRCSLGQTWDGTTCIGTAQKYTWEEAQQAVAEMNRNGGYAGYTDWVLPDTKALQSLLRKHKRVPKIDHTIFPNTPDSFYWSASPYPGDSGHAWGVNFHYGYTSNYYKDGNYYVRAVRAGQ